MEIYVRVKTPGRRRDVLAPVACQIPEGTDSLRQLLTAIVRQEVDRYNGKDTETQLIPFLTRQEVEDRAREGKVSFGRLWSDRKADPGKAVENAIQCWEDGLVRVFMGDEELTRLDGLLVIPQGAVFTFLRLTFLSGAVW